MTAEISTLPVLRRAHALTGEMLELALAGDWDSLPALEDERRHLVERALASPALASEVAQMRELLGRILADSQIVLDRVAAQRDDLRQELGRLGRGRKALHAYGRRQP